MESEIIITKKPHHRKGLTGFKYKPMSDKGKKTHESKSLHK